MKDGSILQSVRINEKGGTERFSGHKELYEKFLKKFPLDPSYGEMCAAMQSGDFGSAFRNAHTIKGVAGNLSIDGLFDVIVPFVEALRNESDIDLAVKLFPGVCEKYTETCEAINKYFEE